jgi:hypothetical protein
LFADVLIVFIVRALIQIFRSQRARSWSVVKGKVTTAQKSGGGIGCTVVELTYKYRVNGELYTGSHTEPFLSAGSARSYLEQCEPGSKLIVRVRPGMPESSFVRDKDLYFHAHGYRLES